MKSSGWLVNLAILALLLSGELGAAEPAPNTFEANKPRLFVLTDIGGHPDDQMSMVRLMTYTNLQIEGLVATLTGSNHAVNPEHIRKIVNAYGIEIPFWRSARS
jgi:hypothetical protein